ncbi:neutral cholesterol ester hydrolase 1 [Gracilinanus agilis]|uniref:neutral cholesterol ester hydrolase 1 n=1 Tax=Gracilinanus agilis TaxID=191870 RepID=UPI001CFCC9A3|nr:neutral cholesterol ester hydrolase 1 [Gracilinanus agilis]
MIGCACFSNRPNGSTRQSLERENCPDVTTPCLRAAGAQAAEEAAASHIPLPGDWRPLVNRNELCILRSFREGPAGLARPGMFPFPALGAKAKPEPPARRKEAHPCCPAQGPSAELVAGPSRHGREKPEEERCNLAETCCCCRRALGCALGFLPSSPLPTHPPPPSSAAAEMGQPTPNKLRRFWVVSTILVSLLAYYVYIPLPADISDPWKLMLLDATFRSAQQLSHLIQYVGLTHHLLALNFIIVSFGRKSAWSSTNVQITDTNFDGVEVRVFEGFPKTKEPLKSGVLYIHGGGWALASARISYYDELCSAMAEELNAVIVSIE